MFPDIKKGHSHAVSLWVISSPALTGWLRFDDALHWAGTYALGRIVVTFAFHTGSLIDDVQNTVAFADGFGGTFGDARTAGDAIFSNFHGHFS